MTYKYLNGCGGATRGCLLAKDTACGVGAYLVIRDLVAGEYCVFELLADTRSSRQTAQRPTFDIDGGNESLFGEFLKLLQCTFTEMYLELVLCDSTVRGSGS